MSQGSYAKRFDAVLIIDADPVRRVAVECALCAAGFSVVAVGSICEVEEWPEGQLVITDLARLTPWWRHIGAVEVVALVEGTEEGRTALSNGATQWLQLPPDPAAVATTLLPLVCRAAGLSSVTRGADATAPPVD